MMKRLHIPTFLLTFVLHCAPIYRLTTPILEAVPVGYAVLLRCAIGAAMLMGSCHAVSGASAYIAGVYDADNPSLPSQTATGQVDQPFDYQIVVMDGGANPDLDYF